MAKKYSTKFSNLTLAVGEEPQDYLSKRINIHWPVMKIYRDIKRISMEKRLPMIGKRTLYLWIKQIENKET